MCNISRTIINHRLLNGLRWIHTLPLAPDFLSLYELSANSKPAAVIYDILSVIQFISFHYINIPRRQNTSCQNRILTFFFFSREPLLRCHQGSNGCPRTCVVDSRLGLQVQTQTQWAATSRMAMGSLSHSPPPTRHAIGIMAMWYPRASLPFGNLTPRYSNLSPCLSTTSLSLYLRDLRDVRPVFGARLENRPVGSQNDEVVRAMLICKCHM